jgi:hypothetical protein
MLPFSQYKEYLSNEYSEIYRKLITDLMTIAVEGGVSDIVIANRILEFENYLESKRISIQSIIKNQTLTSFRNRVASVAFAKKIPIGKVQGLMGKTINTKAIDAILRNNFTEQNRQFQSFLFDMKKSYKAINNFSLIKTENPDALGGLFRIGRRITDEIRQIGLKNIQNKFLTGAAYNKTEKSIFEDLSKLAQDNRLIVGQKIGNKIQVTAFEKLDNPSESYFKLICRDGKMRWFNTDDYSELISRTTDKEASMQGMAESGAIVGNNLVRFNLLGKNYHRINDPCQFIDGQIFSTQKGYVASNGKEYPYLYDNLSHKPYLLPHPRCRHAMFSLLDQPSVLEKYDAVAAQNRYGIKAA